ncbi:hypothetical protein TNCV_4454361 [Trichonephila clavipes]|nr:hypothetical protein TNCV_4454361 [Trichonephila clavipes]
MASEVLSSGLLDTLRDKLMNMEIGQTDEQICQYLSLRWALARALKRNIEYFAEEIKIQLTVPIRTEHEMKLTKDGHAAREEELRTTLADGATVPLRDRSIADSCHLIGQAVSLPTTRIVAKRKSR